MLWGDTDSKGGQDGCLLNLSAQIAPTRCTRKFYINGEALIGSPYLYNNFLKNFEVFKSNIAQLLK